MKLNELKIKINWNRFYICKDCTCSSEHVIFNLMVDDFLIFAKEDFKNLDNKGLVGTLSNAKRAIDWIISYLGFDYLNFNELNYPNVKLIIKKIL